jgi:hypothetical protein
MRIFHGRASTHLDLGRSCRWSACNCVAVLTIVLVCAFATYPGCANAQSQGSQSGSEQTLQEVTVTAGRLHDRDLALAVTGFVASHSAPGTRTNQIGRWHEPVCPLVTRLPAAQDLITRNILDVAQSVGAPTASVGRKCPITVEIVFTHDPQTLLNHIAKSYRPLLGLYPSSQVKQMTTFSRPIQAWYETGTRSMNALPAASHGNAVATGFAALTELPEQHGGSIVDMPIQSGLQIDSDATAMGRQPSGVGGSYLDSDVSSEFIHALIIADSAQLASYSLQSIADYLALLSLTRMAQLDQCAPLPSITDLLASGCTAPVATSLTAADRAYLKSLYAADLQKNLDIERADIHDRMMRQIEGK